MQPQGKEAFSKCLVGREAGRGEFSGRDRGREEEVSTLRGALFHVVP